MKSAICAIARNEEDYLLEWITYHLNLGFNHIFLYDNNDLDNKSTIRLCANKSWKDKVTIIDYRGKNTAQLTAYNECYANIRKDFNWIAFIDIDEFITFGEDNPHNNINSYLENIKKFNVLFINWMYYGDNEKVHQEEESVITRFPLPIPNCDENKHVKSIIKTTADIQFIRNPHCPDGQIQICDDCQRNISQSEPFKQPSFHYLYIRHYGTKTIEEFIKHKVLRGAADQNTNPYKMDLFYKINKHSKAKREIEKQYFHVCNQRENTPLVSVIVPNYNHKKYLKQRIDSILTQTFTDFELILLDDCSTDNSQQLLLSYKDNPHVRYIILNTRNAGSPFLQWEKGIRLARGKYIWIAESDDSAMPNFLSLTVKQLETHPKARLCFTGSYIIGSDNRFVETKEFDQWNLDGKAYIFQPTDYLKTHMLQKNSVYNASMVLFRKEGCLTDICTHYRKMRYCGDWLFWIEQIRKGEVIEVHQKANFFRKHGDNTTNKGAMEGNSLGEIAFIKNILYKNILRKRQEIWEDKCSYYRIVRRFPVSTRRRKKELFRIIAQEGNITFKHYLLGKLCKVLKKLFPH